MVETSDFSEMTRRAVKAIGGQDPDDISLKPREHEFGDEAEQLRWTLRRDEVRKAIDSYYHHKEISRIEQKNVRCLSSWWIIVAGLFAFVAVFALAFTPRYWSSPPVEFIMLAVFIVGFLIWFGILPYLIERAAPREKWVRSRHKAERCRRAIFERIFAAPDAPKGGEDEIDLLPLKLEYFRRYQLDLQKNYYAFASKKEAAIAKKPSRWRRWNWLIWLLMVSAFASMAIVPWSEQKPLWSPLQTVTAFWQDKGEVLVGKLITLSGLAFAAVWLAWATYANSRNSKRNSREYERALEQLLATEKADLERVRRAAKDGKTDEVMEFVRKVHKTMELEHVGWLETSWYNGLFGSASSRPTVQGCEEVQT